MIILNQKYMYVHDGALRIVAHLCNNKCRRVCRIHHPKLGHIISLFGNLVDCDPTTHRHQMARNKRRKRRNLHGLHEEVIPALPQELDRLPPPTKLLEDMKILVNVGDRSVASLLGNTFQRNGFL